MKSEAEFLRCETSGTVIEFCDPIARLVQINYERNHE